MTVIKRNQIIVLSLAVMIVVAGYLNFTYKGSDPFAQEVTGSVGERLGEATYALDGSGDMDIGYAEPVSNILNKQTLDQTASGNTEKQENAQAAESTLSEQYFAETRVEKERVRDEEITLHEKVLANGKASKEAQDRAQQGLEAISQKWEKEMIIERLIKAKGFKDCVVFINNGSVNVVILNGKPLTKAQAAQIQDIVTREAKVGVDRIKVISK